MSYNNNNSDNKSELENKFTNLELIKDDKNIKSHLDASFDLSQISVSEDLINRTLEAIKQKEAQSLVEQPEAEPTNSNTGKKENKIIPWNGYVRRIAGVAAAVLVVAVGFHLLNQITPQYKSSKMDTESTAQDDSSSNNNSSSASTAADASEDGSTYDTAGGATQDEAALSTQEKIASDAEIKMDTKESDTIDSNTELASQNNSQDADTASIVRKEVADTASTEDATDSGDTSGAAATQMPQNASAARGLMASLVPETATSDNTNTSGDNTVTSDNTAASGDNTATSDNNSASEDNTADSSILEDSKLAIANDPTQPNVTPGLMDIMEANVTFRDIFLTDPEQAQYITIIDNLNNREITLTTSEDISGFYSVMDQQKFVNGTDEISALRFTIEATSLQPEEASYTMAIGDNITVDYKKGESVSHSIYDAIDGELLIKNLEEFYFKK